jgi:hypothetical protein
VIAGGAYADAGRQAAPDAIQVADRFHLACNASDVLQRVLVRHAGVVRAATTWDTASQTATDDDRPQRISGGHSVGESSPCLAPDTLDPRPATMAGTSLLIGTPPTRACARNAGSARRLTRYQEVLACTEQECHSPQLPSR